MPSLFDALIQGSSQSAAPQGPAPQAPAAMPTQGTQNPGAQDPGFAQRQQGWKETITQMVQDPTNAMMLMQIGNAMANAPNQGNPAQSITNALTEGFQYRARNRQILEEMQLKKGAAERDQQRVDDISARTDIARDTLEQRGREAEDTAAYRQGQLANQRRANEIAGVNAQTNATARGTDTDRLAAAYAEHLGIPLSEARIFATTQKDRRKAAADMMNYKERTHSQSVQGMSGTPFNREQAIQETESFLDRLYGASPGRAGAEASVPGTAQGKAEWNALTEQEKTAWREKAASNPTFRQKLLERIGSDNL